MMQDNSKKDSNNRRAKITSDRFTKLLAVWAMLIATIWIGGPYVREIVLVADKPRAISTRADLTEFEQVSTELFEAASPSVAYIFTESNSESPVAKNTSQGGTGSGFVWDGAGNVVTNFHVVQGADRIAVRLDSGEAVSAVLVGSAPDYDLAVLKLLTVQPGLTPIPIGKSADLKVGQAVFAIGNPFGLSRSLSTGVVSALNRHLPTASGRRIHSVVQTDAAVNPGNSGGPLLDSAGRLIGVTTAIVSESGSSAGVGFAIPVDIVNRVVPRLIKDGKFPRPGIGITIVDEKIGARFGLRGVIVADVFPGSVAAKAGLAGLDRQTGQPGDVIIEVNRRGVGNVAAFSAALEKAGIGSEVELTVLSKGQKRRLRIKVMDIS